MTPDLSEEEKIALVDLLKRTVEADHYPLSLGVLAYLGRLGQVERGKWLISLDQTPEGLHYAGDDGAI